MAVAAMIAGGVLVAAAPAASAATQTIPVQCTDPIVFGDTMMIYASPGDTLIFEVTAGDCSWGDLYQPNFNDLFVDWADQHTPGPYTWTIREDAPLGTYSLPGSYVFAFIDGALNGVNFDLTLVAPGGDTYIPIPPWVQGYGRASATDVCLDGWTASWELWPHDGTGGWVCTREIPSLG